MTRAEVFRRGGESSVPDAARVEAPLTRRSTCRLPDRSRARRRRTAAYHDQAVPARASGATRRSAQRL